MAQKAKEPPDPPPKLEPAEVLQKCQQYANVSSSLGAADLVELGALSYSLFTYQKQVLAEVLSENATGPILIQYSQDTTPVARRGHLQTSSSGASKRRSIRVSGDLLVQQVFLSTINSTGSVSHRLFHPPPIALSHGKAASALAACAKWCPGLFGICGSTLHFRVRHVVIDRGIGSDVCHYVSGSWVEELRADAGDGSRDADVDVDAMTPFELHTFVHCSAHDCHNALKWSQHARHSDNEFMTSAFVALAALKGSIAGCVAVMGAWLREVVVFKAAEALPSSDLCDMLWTTLGMHSQTMDFLVACRLRWTGSELQIWNVMSVNEDFLQNLSASLLDSWHFAAFTASRWCSLGPSARSYIIGSLTGYDSLCQYAISSGHLGDCEKNGLARLNNALLRRFLTVSGLCAFLPESCLASILEDPRVAKHQVHLWEDVRQEHGHLQTLPTEFWKALHLSAPDVSWLQLQDEVLQSSSIAMAFLQHRIFRTSMSMPWIMCSMPSSDAIGNNFQFPKQLPRLWSACNLA